MCIAEIWYEQWNPKVCRDPRSWRPVTTNNSGSVQQLGEVLRKTCPPPCSRALGRGIHSLPGESPCASPKRLWPTTKSGYAWWFEIVCFAKLRSETSAGANWLALAGAKWLALAGAKGLLAEGGKPECAGGGSRAGDASVRASERPQAGGTGHY